VLAVDKIEGIPDELSHSNKHCTRVVVDGGPKGAKRIELIGLGEKRQITAVVCGTLKGEFLPL